MRLIDTDTLMKEVCDIRCRCEPDECDYADEYGKYCELAQYIENAPTMDAVPLLPLAKWLSHASMAPNARGDILSLSSDADAFFKKNTQYWEEFLREMDWGEVND